MTTLTFCSMAFAALLSGEKGNANLSVQLSNGKTITPQCLSLEQAETHCVKGNPKAPRLAQRSDRQVRTYRLNKNQEYGLAYTLSSYSRTPAEGVSYTRLILTLKNTTQEPIGIDKISFMRGKTVPESFTIVGETDGAIATFEKENSLCFMAVEHPMSKLMIDNTTHPRWNPEIFKNRIWEFPVHAAGGDLTLTFRYTGGAHRADIKQVEVLGSDIKDVHHGFTGYAKSGNVYRLKNVPAGPAKVRVTFTYETDPKQNDSYGVVDLEGIKMESRRIASAWLPIADKLYPGQTWKYSAVIGKVKEPKQLRRAFLAYLESERAYPFRVYPHYNSWYDLNIHTSSLPWNKRMNEAQCLDAVRKVGKALSERGEKMNSFLWDDGWDDWDSFWNFHGGFPNGFDKISKEAAKWGSFISAWMSPCGGYGSSCARRVAYAKKIHIIDKNDEIMRLSKPVYYKAFRDRCLDMIRRYHMDIFKFDRMGCGYDNMGVGPEYAADIRAVFALIDELRVAKPDIYVNTTVGTWASPFWLLWSDSVWRGLWDWDTFGYGPAREQNITFRDNAAHDRFVKQSPLFPMSGLMLHGVTITRHGPPARADHSQTPAATVGVKNDLWMQAGAGIGLQEYYISPDIISDEWWDEIARAIHWTRVNEDTLRDSHWIGGDPLNGKIASVYGYASLGKKKGIITVRNPSNEVKDFKMCLDELFEMPQKDLGQKIKGQKIVYQSVKSSIPTFAKTSEQKTLTLKPFEVVIFEFAL